MTDQLDDASVEMNKKSGGNRKWLFLGVAGVATLAVCGIVTIAFIVFDPFGFIDRFFGGGDPIASVVPEETTIYFSADLLQMTSSEGLDAIIQTFAEAAGEDAPELDGMISILDGAFEDSFELTFTDDVLPWVGQYAGISVSNIEIDPFGGLDEDPQVVIVIEVRDSIGADQFIENFVAALEKNTFAGGEFEEDEYEGATLYVLDEGFDQMAVGRSGDFVFFSDRVESIHAAIDAQSGASLADSPMYQETIRQLSNQRMMTVYIDAGQLQEEFSSFGDAGLTALCQQPVVLDAFAMSFEVIEEGMQFDFVVAINYDELGDFDLNVDIEAPTTDILIPEDAFFYMASGSNSVNPVTQEEYYQRIFGDEDCEESIQLLEEVMGIEILDLLSNLNGEFVLAMMPSSSGALATMGQIPLGFVFMIGINDEDVILDAISTLNDTIARDEFSGFGIEESSFDEFTLFTLGQEIPFVGGVLPIVTYGVGQDYLIIASSESVIADTFNGGPSLADNENYQSVWDAFPAEDIPVLYFDVRGMFEIIRDGLSSLDQEGINEFAAFLEPITAFAMTSNPRAGEVTRVSLIIFIDKK
ncbi:MAG: DUF3352 domain-containing protein [Chloroflexi bacterium]|nr:DUF3352 domain-containing protein [Chloroflexota bacterium]